MKIPEPAFSVTDWPQIAPTEHLGYLADHRCDRGHILYVLEGSLVSELKDGRRFTLSAGIQPRFLWQACPSSQ